MALLSSLSRVIQQLEGSQGLDNNAHSRRGGGGGGGRGKGAWMASLHACLDTITMALPSAGHFFIGREGGNRYVSLLYVKSFMSFC